MARLKKDKSVHVLLEQLRSRLGDRAFEVVDHWDGDLCAIGVVRPGQPSPLVYISTWRQAPGRCRVSLERPPRPGSDEPYDPGGELEGVDIEGLVSTVMRHLQLDDIAGLPK